MPTNVAVEDRTLLVESVGGYLYLLEKRKPALADFISSKSY